MTLNLIVTMYKKSFYQHFLCTEKKYEIKQNIKHFSSCFIVESDCVDATLHACMYYMQEKKSKYFFFIFYSSVFVCMKMIINKLNQTKASDIDKIFSLQ